LGRQISPHDLLIEPIWEKEESRELFVAGLVLDPASNAPIVILKDSEGDVCLPIWLGLAEATAIASALKQVAVSRPMTHDLLRIMIEELGGSIVQIFIKGVDNNTFLADIEVKQGNIRKTIDARPSDAIALAVRTNSPIIVFENVLERARVELVPALPGDEKELTPGTIDDHFSEIDQEKWQEILESMDPDDFKYKM